MEPNHTSSTPEETALEPLDSHERLNELIDPIMQPKSVEKSEDEPVFQCKGDELRLAKMTTWMISITLIAAMWLAATFLAFLFNLPLSTLIIVSALILGCAVAMQLKKEKSWIKVYKDRIEWSSFLIERQATVENLAESPYLIEVGVFLNSPTVKTSDGRVLGKLPATFSDNFVNLLASLQKLNIPVEINLFQLYQPAANGQGFAPIRPFDFKRIVAMMLPFVGIVLMLQLPRDTWMKPLLSGIIVLFFSLASIVLQVSLHSNRKNKTGLIYEVDAISRVNRDDVIWRLNAADLRSIIVKSNAFAVRAEAVTFYGRRHDLGTSALHALKFALANSIPIVSEEQLAVDRESSQK